MKNYLLYILLIMTIKMNANNESRRYNQFEKTILETLLEKTTDRSEPVNLLEFFKESVLVNRGIKIDNEQKHITIHIDRETDKGGPLEILNFLTLMDYLESNGLIIKFENWFARSENREEFISANLTIDENKYFIKPNKETKYKTILPNYSITFPKGYYEKVLTLYNKDILISPELSTLINNKFMTIELKLYKEAKVQTYISFTALGLALITLFLSWYILYKSDKKEIIINKSQIELFQKPMEQLIHKLDDKNQSLNVKENVPEKIGVEESDIEKSNTKLKNE